MKKKNQVEDITALTAPPVFTTKVVVPNATSASSTVGKETHDGNHVAEVAPPSLPLIFHVVSRAPLAPPLALGFKPNGPLAPPRSPDFAETCVHTGVILGPNAHDVQVAPPFAPFLTTNRVDRSERRKQKKKGAKLKKRKDKE